MNCWNIGSLDNSEKMQNMNAPQTDVCICPQNAHILWDISIALAQYVATDNDLDKKNLAL